MLTRRRWNILNCCADQDEPIEQVYAAYSEHDQTVDPAELLSDLLQLFQAGLITIRQVPILSCGQQFAERDIVPAVPADIVGDLADRFAEFQSKRDYLWREPGRSYDPTPVAVPLGIWIDMTPAGRQQWDRPEYSGYWSEEIV